MVNDAYIRSHYKKVAQNFGPSSLSSIQDPYIRTCEENFFIREIQNFIKVHSNLSPHDIIVMDFGCGNGHLLSVLRKYFPEIKLVGLEFTPELLEIAQKRKLENTSLYLGDIRQKLPFEDKAHIIITERVIINLLSWKQQELGLRNIAQHLQKDGLYLMSESFREPWIELNLARREVGLDQIKQSQHNRYLAGNAIDFMAKQLNLKQIDGQTAQNFLSTHFYISRVLHPSIRPEGAKIKSSRMVDFFNQALAPAAGNFSPILFHVFHKRT